MSFSSGILLLVAFAMGIVINSVRKSKIRIPTQSIGLSLRGILVLFALIPQLAYFFSGLFGFIGLQTSATGYCDDSHQALSSVLRNLQAYL